MNQSGVSRRGRGLWPLAARLLGLLLLALVVAAPSLALAQEASGEVRMDPPAPSLSFGPIISPLYGSQSAVVPDSASAEPDAASPGSSETAFAEVGSPDQQRALNCMAMAIAYEAGNQPLAGQEAVGQVILNRLHTQRFPKSVCGVVFAGSERRTGCQFTFTCDGSILQPLSTARLMNARMVALSVMSGQAPDRVSGATHYHADYVLPYWASSGQRVAKIGAHIFYRMAGDSVQPLRPVDDSYVEPVIALPRHGRMRRGWPLSGPALARAMPVSAHAKFAPWGLPVTDMAQN